MGRGDKQPGDEILVARLHARAALAAAPLRAISRKRHPLDVAKMRHGHDHVFPLNEILVLDTRRIVENDAPARRRVGALTASISSLMIEKSLARECNMSR